MDEGVEIDTTIVVSSVVESSNIDDENPPEYHSLGARVIAEAGTETPPLDYYDAVVGTSPRTQGTLTTEAPPSYQDIFGAKNDVEENDVEVAETEQNRRWRRIQRPHTLPRRQCSNQDVQASNSSCGSFRHIASRVSVVLLSLIAFTLPFSMLIIGIINLDVCSSQDVPLYLIIAGCCLCFEICIHFFTMTASLSTENKKINRYLRVCDCFAFFILVWILVGSNWIFRLSFRPQPCLEPDKLSDTELSSSGDDFLTTTLSSCEDCSGSVYSFAVGVIILQYFIVFSVFMVCCSVAMKKYRNFH